jgi:hypothetical protein
VDAVSEAGASEIMREVNIRKRSALHYFSARNSSKLVSPSLLGRANQQEYGIGSKIIFN